jgi:ectoine hydroxylase-related dioxygenase (phytanoyl-CoA dioxygenase family)
VQTDPLRERDASDGVAVDAAAVLQESGYVVCEGAIDAESVTNIREQLDRELQTTPRGRNHFEGFRTRRVYSLLAKVSAASGLVEHEFVTAILDELLLPGYLLSALLAIDLLPSESAQAWHYDDGFYVLPRPRPAIGISTIWAIDDFTASNGSTEVVPASHILGDVVPDEHQAVKVCMPSGSVLVMLGTLWHRGGENGSADRRLAVTAQYCQPWARQQEQMMLAVSPERAAQLSPTVRSMLGYSIHPPFMGHVGGLHPSRLLPSSSEAAVDCAGDQAASFWDRPPSELYQPRGDRRP